MRVLIVEDDADQLDLMTYALRRSGFDVLGAIDGTQALHRWQTEKPDLVLLDANIPRINGYEVCKRIRDEGRTPVIMVTGRDEEDDVLRGFQMGADEYVVKPFSAKQLVARMRAVARRSKMDLGAEPTGEVRFADIVLDLQSHVAVRAGRDIQLTRLEFRILWLLASNPGRVIPHSRLVEYAWGYDGGDSSLLKTHICHIRVKLSLPEGKPTGISAVPGVGYRLSVGAEDEPEEAAVSATG